MRKIPTVFVRDEVDRRFVTRQITPGCERALAEGIATFKWNGTSCLLNEAGLWKRYEATRQKRPSGKWIPAQPEPDPVTGKWPAWVLVGDGPEDRWHREGRESLWPRWPGIYGTYELIGPKVQGNPHGGRHRLERHGAALCTTAPRDFDGLREWLQRQKEASSGFEGLVWWLDGAPAAKLKAKDFAYPTREDDK